MGEEIVKSLSDEATLAGNKQKPARDVSLSDERTLGGGADAAGLDTVMDGIEVVDLQARYTIEGPLGQGGMGAVLLATDTRLGRKVAIKRILGEAARSATAIQRFLTEAKAVAALNHPNVVQIHDYGRAKDGPFLIMEYVDGGSLAEKCKEGALPLEKAIDLACHVCDGLAKAHDLGIIHRDIKPANVLLTKDGVPKLTDFGLAKADSSDHQMTMTGAVMGTPDFMSPEQRRDAAEVDSRSDLWSLAATVYQMVTGRSPKVIRLDEVPQGLRAVLAKGLEDRKADRYQTAKEFAAAVRGGGGVVAAPTAALVEGEPQDGQCVSCGTINADTSRKFCKKCGESLRTGCLKCDAQIPVWDTICGECGGNQPGILCDTRERLIAEQAEAASLAADFQLDQAIAIAERIAAESHAALADLASAARSFVETASVQRDQQNAAAAALFEEAREHCKAFDYPSAIQALEKIPIGGLGREMEQLLLEVRQRQEESSRSLAEIGSRVKAKEIDGLIPSVTRAIELRGDRMDLAKLRDQLLQRREKRLAHARRLLKAGEGRAAAHAIEGVSPADLSAEQQQVVTKIRLLAEMENTITAAVKAARKDGTLGERQAQEIVRQCQAYLDVNPNHPKVKDLLDQVLARSGEILNNSVNIQFRKVVAGAPAAVEGSVLAFDLDGLSARKLAVPKDFYLGVYPVTERQWAAVMDGSNVGSDCPATNVSWTDAQEFCRRLSLLPAEQSAGRIYRLPTEAEWQYACQSGTANTIGGNETLLRHLGWFKGNSNGQKHPVGKKDPNGWGFFDMLGNVWEWCSDGDSKSRSRRGGSWHDTSERCRSSYRASYAPTVKDGRLGFRLALSMPAR